jgi:hypothetical protein
MGSFSHRTLRGPDGPGQMNGPDAALNIECGRFDLDVGEGALVQDRRSCTRGSLLEFFSHQSDPVIDEKRVEATFVNNDAVDLLV